MVGVSVSGRMLPSFVHPEPRPGLRARQHEAGTGRCIDSEAFAGFVERHEDPVSRSRTPCPGGLAQTGQGR